MEPQGLQFNEIIEVNNFSAKFRLALTTTIVQDYINSDVSFYMMTEVAEIFDADNKNAFSLILGRSFDLAIFGAMSNLYIETFDSFKIQDVRNYVSSLLLSYCTDDLDSKIQRNYL